MGAEIFFPRDVIAVTPSDTVSNIYNAGLYVGVGGDVAVLLRDNSVSVVYKNVPNGSFLPVHTSKVLSTGTTATNILGMNHEG